MSAIYEQGGFTRGVRDLSSVVDEFVLAGGDAERAGRKSRGDGDIDEEDECIAPQSFVTRREFFVSFNRSTY